jgi:hypothetical protein
VRPGHPEAASFDYIRHGTTTLFAALEVATGKVTEACTERHRHQEFLAFLRQVAAAYPRRQLHVVVDNLSTTSIRRCVPGSSAIRGCSCTSPRPRDPG